LLATSASAQGTRSSISGAVRGDRASGSHERRGPGWWASISRVWGSSAPRSVPRSLGSVAARFLVGDITATGLTESSFDGAMSIDVLWAVPDKLAALKEVARILKPGARLAFTNWDRDRTPPGYLPPLADHRPLLEQAGFEIETYQAQPDAETKRRAVYEAIVAAEQDLVQEMGEKAAARLMFEAKGTLGLTDGVDYLAHSRRIYVVARKVRHSAEGR
jgi:SAM-dependent methyltransferase